MKEPGGDDMAGVGSEWDPHGALQIQTHVQGRPLQPPSDAHQTWCSHKKSDLLDVDSPLFKYLR